MSAVLDGIDAERAAARPIAGAHTIAELVFHLIDVQRLVLARCGGEAAPFVEAESWTDPALSGEEAWTAAVAALLDGEARIAAAARTFDAARLDAPVAEGSDRGVELLLGHLQHDLYHTGQIALLKKALGG